VIGRVEHLEQADAPPTGEPLLYFQGRYRTTGQVDPS
jgi:hypothetical protein